MFKKFTQGMVFDGGFPVAVGFVFISYQVGTAMEAANQGIETLADWWTQIGDLNGVAALITALMAVVTTVVAAVKYLSRRDKQIAARDAFRAVVDSLSSTNEVQRLAGAILLRRFFDRQTELGQGGTPYAREAIEVMAAILREAETGNFQKLIADGLGYAPLPKHVDLQRTNLQKAYLGRKGDTSPNLYGADFYRADLSGASLRDANATKAIFYQARLHKTVFKKADLSEASFFESDLLGANFTGAILRGATFVGARNIPSELCRHIGSDGAYVGPERFEGSIPPAESKGVTVFLSKPGTLNVQQRDLMHELTSVLAKEGIQIVTVEREDYPGFGAIAEVRRVLSGCEGVVIVAFRQLQIIDAIWRAGTEEAKPVEGIALPTPWNHVETGMAAMVGLPTFFLVERGLMGSLFEPDGADYILTDVDLSKPDLSKLRRSLTAWCRSVRETLR